VRIPCESPRLLSGTFRRPGGIRVPTSQPNAAWADRDPHRGVVDGACSPRASARRVPRRSRQPSPRLISVPPSTGRPTRPARAPCRPNRAPEDRQSKHPIVGWFVAGGFCADWRASRRHNAILALPLPPSTFRHAMCRFETFRCQLAACSPHVRHGLTARLPVARWFPDARSSSPVLPGQTSRARRSVHPASHGAHRVPRISSTLLAP